MKSKLTIKSFEEKYPTDDVCLGEIFQQRYGKHKLCPKCERQFKYYRVKGRKCYSCQYCSNQIHPLAGTIFHKSDTSLKLWFYAIFLFSTSKNGVSAKELERQLGVTYKCAWRMAQQIRTLFEDNDPDGTLGNIVEADETYYGGKKRGKRGRGAGGKTPIIGITERGGNIKAIVTTNVKRSTVLPFIKKNVRLGTTLMTDQFSVYSRVSLYGYQHHRINHSAKQYVDGIIHTNSIEGFWSQLKRSVSGTYHSVSPKYLQRYVNEFAFRYNARKLETPLFDLFLGRVVLTAG